MRLLTRVYGMTKCHITLGSISTHTVIIILITATADMQLVICGQNGVILICREVHLTHALLAT